MTRLHRRIFSTMTRYGLTSALLALAVVVGSRPAPAQADGPATRVKETVQVAANGDARFSRDVELSPAFYTALKKTEPNLAVLLRHFDLRAQPNWYVVERMKGEWDDFASTIRLQWTVKGLARCGKDRRWEIPLSGDLVLATDQSQQVVMTGAAVIADLPAILTTTVKLPDGASDIKLASSPPRLRYRARDPKGEGERTAVEMSLDVRPHLMACLAKSHANPKFTELWAARTRLTNTGDQPLTDFRVRFRIADYTSDWSAWSQSALVVPGQTVVDAYFPVLDSKTIAALEGKAQVEIKIEYEYKREDGDVVRESERKPVRLLGRNLCPKSLLSADQVVDERDFNLEKMVYASIVTAEDPVIRQVAGWVSQQAGGSAQSLDVRDAIKFLAELWRFFCAHKISYQTPRSGLTDGQFYQHIKFGRDVLKDRAGTCVDLAILYASVCEAVGLRPELVCVPGHVFVKVNLPSGVKIAVEATMMPDKSFDDAVKTGALELKAAVEQNQATFIDIKRMHADGVLPPELPVLSEDWLEKTAGMKPLGPPVAAQPAAAPKPAAATPAAAPASDRYAAIAYSTSTGRYGYGFNCATRERAEEVALSHCKVSDARVVTWCKNAWIVLAKGGNSAYGYAWDGDPEKAKEKALGHCWKYTSTAQVVVCVHAKKD